MQILNTRPTDRAQTLTHSLQRMGHEVYELPLLELAALPLDGVLEQQFQQLLSAKCVVVVSSIAAELGIKYAQQCGIELSQLQNLYWVAVGKTTQKKLLEYGFNSVCPQVESSEGMLKLDVFKSFNQQSIAFWRGIGGRTVMMQQLSQQGCTILNMLLYSRKMPDISLETLQSFGIQRGMVLISSEASWKNWLVLWTQYASLPRDFVNYHYIVLGTRVSWVVRQDLQAMGCDALVIDIQQLSPIQIHQGLQNIQL